jgi:hypothetical protein
MNGIARLRGKWWMGNERDWLRFDLLRARIRGALKGVAPKTNRADKFSDSF